MSNQTFEALPLAALVLQMLVLGWRLWRGDMGPMAALNGVMAAGLAIPLGLAVTAGPAGWAEGVYATLAGLFAFALAVLATSLGWTARRAPWLGVLVALEFALTLLMTLAATIFALTFEVKVEL